MKNTGTAALEALFKEKPKFHGSGGESGTQDYSIAEAVLRWMLEHLAPGSVTLETGCGYSTIVFALGGALHTAISPFAAEHDAIRKWLAGHGIDAGDVEFIQASSQNVLPALCLPGRKAPDLDMVLIDGCHAFPSPFIDWYYTADRVKPGGFVIVDDTQLVTGAILRDFLRAETERWQRVTDISKTSIFLRLSSAPAARGVSFVRQPYVNDPFIRWRKKQEGKWRGVSEKLRSYIFKK